MRASVLSGALVALAMVLLFLPAFSQGGGAVEPAEPTSAPVAAPARAKVRSPLLERSGWRAAVAPAVARSRWADVLAALPSESAAEDLVETELLGGLALLRTGREAEAVELLQRAARLAASSAHPLEDAAWSSLAEAAAAAGEPELRVEALLRLRALRPADAETAAGLAEALADAGREAELLELVRGEPKDALPSGARARVLAAALSARGAPAAERSAWAAELGWERAGTRAGLAAAGSSDWQRELARALGAGEWERVLARIEALVVADQARTALEEIDSLLSADPPAAALDRARQYQGRALRVLGRQAEALAVLEGVGSSDALVRCRAKYNAALAALALKRRGDHVRLLREAAEGPSCEWRDRALERLADRDLEAGHRLHARERLQRLATDGAEEATRAAAAWRRAWTWHEDGEADAALAAFTEVEQDFPRRTEAAAALYWSARLLREGGAPDEAGLRLERLAAEHPYDYYGSLAASELGLEPSLPRIAEPGELEAALSELLGQLATDSPAASERAAARWRCGLVLPLMGELEAAAVLPAAGVADEAGRWALRVALLGEMGRHRQALVELRSAVPDWRTRRDLPALAWAGAYPRAYSELVERHASATGLEPALVYALIHQESVFDAEAVSHAGARGLMQIMPGTNRTIAAWFHEHTRTADLIDPEHNLRYGTAYLRRLLDNLEHPELALAGYNAGGTRARRWWRELPREDLPLFVESIPFDETRHYVKAVTWNRQLYRGVAREAAGVSGQ